MAEIKLVGVPERLLNEDFEKFSAKRLGRFETPRRCMRCVGVWCEDIMQIGEPVWKIFSANGGVILGEVNGVSHKRCILRDKHIRSNGIQITNEEQVSGVSFGRGK